MFLRRAFETIPQYVFKLISFTVNFLINAGSLLKTFPDYNPGKLVKRTLF